MNCESCRVLGFVLTEKPQCHSERVALWCDLSKMEVRHCPECDRETKTEDEQESEGRCPSQE
jgi:hypothetical protein